VKNLSHPNATTVDRGDFVETPGGGYGLYIGTTERGVVVVHYPDRAPVTFAHACATFDEREERRERARECRRVLDLLAKLITQDLEDRSGN